MALIHIVIDGVEHLVTEQRFSAAIVTCIERKHIPSLLEVATYLQRMKISILEYILTHDDQGKTVHEFLKEKGMYHYIRMLQISELEHFFTEAAIHFLHCYAVIDGLYHPCRKQTKIFYTITHPGIPKVGLNMEYAARPVPTAKILNGMYKLPPHLSILFLGKATIEGPIEPLVRAILQFLGDCNDDMFIFSSGLFVEGNTTSIVSDLIRHKNMTHIGFSSTDIVDDGDILQQCYQEFDAGDMEYERPFPLKMKPERKGMVEYKNTCLSPNVDVHILGKEWGPMNICSTEEIISQMVNDMKDIDVLEDYITVKTSLPKDVMQFIEETYRSPNQYEIHKGNLETFESQLKECLWDHIHREMEDAEHYMRMEFIPMLTIDSDGVTIVVKNFENFSTVIFNALCSMFEHMRLFFNDGIQQRMAMVDMHGERLKMELSTLERSYERCFFTCITTCDLTYLRTLKILLRGGMSVILIRNCGMLCNILCRALEGGDLNVFGLEQYPDERRASIISYITEMVERYREQFFIISSIRDVQKICMDAIYSSETNSVTKWRKSLSASLMFSGYVDLMITSLSNLTSTLNGDDAVQVITDTFCRIVEKKMVEYLDEICLFIESQHDLEEQIVISILRQLRLMDIVHQQTWMNGFGEQFAHTYGTLRDMINEKNDILDRVNIDSFTLHLDDVMELHINYIKKMIRALFFFFEEDDRFFM